MQHLHWVHLFLLVKPSYIRFHVATPQFKLSECLDNPLTTCPPFVINCAKIFIHFIQTCQERRSKKVVKLWNPVRILMRNSRYLNTWIDARGKCWMNFKEVSSGRQNIFGGRIIFKTHYQLTCLLPLKYPNFWNSELHTHTRISCLWSTIGKWNIRVDLA